MTPPSLSFGTFWAGTALSPFEAACLHSFALRGYEVTLYSYGSLEGVPPAIRQEDAAAILDEQYLDAFVYDGRPNLSHFSDLFRYRMFQKTPHAWIDADVLMLRRFEHPLPSTMFAREQQGSICGAIMRISPEDPLLGELCEATLSLADRDLRWGETGPLLLSRLLRRHGRQHDTFGPEAFYPLSHDEFWKTLLPEHADECTSRCRNAYTLHLFNNVLTRFGIWKRFAPPAGSFLHNRLMEDNTLGFFSGVYPAEVMRQMIENWRLRMNGGDLGIRGLSRQIVPSLFRTIRHHGVRLF